MPPIAMHVERHVFPAGLEVGDVRRAAHDLHHVVHGEADAGLVRHRRKMQARIGGTAGGADHHGGVLQRLACDDVARAQPAVEQGHHRAAGFHGPAVAVLVGRRRTGRAGQRQADRLADHRHRVGGELAAAGAGRRTRHAFQFVQFGVRHLAGGVLADRLEHINHGHVAVLEPAGQDRAAIHEHAGDVQPQHRHHHARQRLVAARQADQRVVAMPAHRQFHGVCDQVARDQRGLHALVAHGDAVGHRDRGEFARRAAGLVDALLHRLRLARERDVARRGLVPAGGDADEGLVDLVLGQPHRVVVAAMRCAAGSHRHVAGRHARLVPAPGQHRCVLSWPLRHVIASVGARPNRRQPAGIPDS